MAEVVLENATKTYSGDVVGVEDVSLQIEDKEFLVLVGPSGSGKSTALRLIAGLEEITKGNVYIGGRLVNDIPPKDRDIAMVFQNYALYPHMSVYNNMAFGLKLRRFPRAEIQTRVEHAATILGIKHLLNRRPRALSGGERQRVAVGRAIVRQPKAFLFDEPLSNLDAKLRVEMRAELSRLHHRLQTTMIYVTHDQIEAMTLGDRIAVLNNGMVHQVAKPIELYDRPENKFVAGFIGTPPMNFVDGRLATKAGEMVFDGGTVQVRICEPLRSAVSDHVGEEVTLGIRPEDIEDARNASPECKDRPVDTIVRVVEPLGDEKLLHLQAGEWELVARVEPHHDAEVDEKLSVLFDINKVHLFDKATGDNISLNRADS